MKRPNYVGRASAFDFDKGSSALKSVSIASGSVQLQGLLPMFGPQPKYMDLVLLVNHIIGYLMGCPCLTVLDFNRICCSLLKLYLIIFTDQYLTNWAHTKPNWHNLLIDVLYHCYLLSGHALLMFGLKFEREHTYVAQFIKGGNQSSHRMDNKQIQWMQSIELDQYFRLAILGMLDDSGLTLFGQNFIQPHSNLNLWSRELANICQPIVCGDLSFRWSTFTAKVYLQLYLSSYFVGL